MVPAGSSSEPLTIDAEHASMSYGGRTVLTDVSFSVGRASRIGIVGESGSGKTTLARLLAGLSHPTGGAVTVSGLPWRRVRRTDWRRRHVQLIQQDPYSQLTGHLSARAAVSEAARVCRKVGIAEARAVADEIFGAVGLTRDQASRKPRQLSGGQCQRVAIARAFASDAQILIADEPTSSLDVCVQAQIINLLLRLGSTRERGLVLISHDLAVVRHLTEEILVIYQGEIVERGRTAEVLSDPRHEYTRQLCGQLKLDVATLLNA